MFGINSQLEFGCFSEIALLSKKLNVGFRLAPLAKSILLVPVRQLQDFVYYRILLDDSGSNTVSITIKFVNTQYAFAVHDQTAQLIS
jgi:hypothetical protein